MHPSKQTLHRLVVSVGLALTLGACAQMDTGKRPLSTLSAVDLQLPITHQTTRIHPLFWHDLNDVQLNRLLDSAVRQAPSLTLALAKIDEADAQYGRARSGLGPSIDAKAGYSRQRYSENTSQGQMQKQRTGSDYASNSDLGLNLAWDLDVWGKHRQDINAVMGERLARKMEWEQSRLLLIDSVFSHYNQWQLLAQEKYMLTQRITVQQKINQIESQQIKAGIAAPASQYETQLRINQLQTEQSNLSIQQIAHEQALAALVGESVQKMALHTVPYTGRVPALTVAQLDSGLLAARPDIATQQALLMAQSARIESAKAEFYPQVKIQTMAGYSAIDLADLFKPSSLVLGFVPAVTLPVFHSGQLRSQLHQRQAQYDQLIAMYNQTVLNAVRDAATAMGQHQAYGVVWNQQKQALAIQTKRLSSQVKRQQAGLGSALPILYEQDQQLSLGLQALQSEAGLRQTWMNLHLQFGGGAQLTNE